MDRPELECWLPGNPVAKGRPRVTRGGWTFTPKRTKEAEKAIATQVRTFLPACWKPDTDSHWGISIAFYCKNRVRGDVDNLKKLAMDALTGVLWANDKQVYYSESAIASEASLSPGMAIVAWKMTSQAGIKPRASVSAHLGSC